MWHHLQNCLKERQNSSGHQVARERLSRLRCFFALLPFWPLRVLTDHSNSVDTSDVGTGSVLMQGDDLGIDRPLSFFSKKLTSCQRNYSVIEKEALALIMTLMHFDVYISGSCTPLAMSTEHNPLTFFNSCSACIWYSGLSWRAARWCSG